MPPDYVRQLLPTEVVGLLVVAAAVVWGVRMLIPVGSRVHAIVQAIVDLAESWRGTPEVRDASGVVVEEAHPGVLGRLARIEHEVTPNHGTSAHDGIIKRIDALQRLVSDALAEIGEWRAESAARDKDHSGRLYELEQLVERLRDPHTD